MRDINRQCRGNSIAQSGKTHYHAQLGLDPDKGPAINELIDRFSTIRVGPSETDGSNR